MPNLGTAVVIRQNRTGELAEGVVVEVVPPQKFPIRFPSATHSLDFQTRYVIATARRNCIRALSELEVVSL